MSKFSMVVLPIFLSAAIVGSKPARAGGLFEDASVLNNAATEEFGYVAYRGSSEFSLPEMGLSPSVNGVFWRDRNGLVTRVSAAVIVIAAAAFAAASPKKVEYTPEYKITTYRSEAEKAQIMDNAGATASSLMSTRNAEFGLQIFSRDKFGRSDTTGYKLEMLLGSGGESWSIETGLGVGSAESLVTKNGVQNILRYDFVGMPVRLSIAAGKARIMLNYDWNWSQYKKTAPEVMPRPDGAMVYDIRRSPLTLSVQGALMGRLGLTVGGTLPSTSALKNLGYFAAVAARF